jgi:hypothetical protein
MAAEVDAAASVLRTLPGTGGRSCAVARVHLLAADIAHKDLRIAGADAEQAIASLFGSHTQDPHPGNACLVCGASGLEWRLG